MTLVSVITPTWQRHRLLIDRCMKSVRGQTWHEVQHVIVSDGPDPELDELIQHTTAAEGGMVTLDHLPDHAPELSAWGSRARNHALSLCKGEYIAYLDDDNEYRANHIAILVDTLMCNPHADFTFSQMYRHKYRDFIGGPFPAYGSIDSSLIMHRAGLPERLGMWPSPIPAGFGDTHAPDWYVVERWLMGGARWVHAPHVTLDYYEGGSS